MSISWFENVNALLVRKVKIRDGALDRYHNSLRELPYVLVLEYIKIEICPMYFSSEASLVELQINVFLILIVDVYMLKPEAAIIKKINIIYF